jgi:hypothetical protein
MKTDLSKWRRVARRQAAILGLVLGDQEVLLVHQDLAIRAKPAGNDKNFYLQFYYNAQNEFTTEELRQIKRVATRWLIDNYEKNIII